MKTHPDLQNVADHKAICAQIYLYCRAMDRMDHQIGYSIWHEGGTADYGEDVYQGSGRGFIDHVCKVHGQLLCHSHQVTNIVLKLDGDSAVSEAYVTANLRILRDGRMMQMTVLSRYIDRWSKRSERWAIDHREAVIDMDEIREVTPMKQHDRGRRDTSDPSYAIFPKVTLPDTQS